MEELGLYKEDYGFYLDMRKYGSARHAGFGLGFERCVMYLTGVSNIRDVIPYPRTDRNCELKLMLNILQYQSLIAAFIVPWMIGSIVKFAKLGDKKKVTVISVVLAVCILVIALCVTLAFKLSGAAS